MNWHCISINEAYEKFGTSPEGLSDQVVTGRIGKYGLNELKETEGRGLFMMFIDQFRDFMIIVLIAAAVISGMMGEMADTIAIVVIVILNAIIGFVQEYRAGEAIKALKQMAAPEAIVMREGHMMSISASLLVPGDIVLLDTGRIVPADMRLTETNQLKVEEAALTGESVPSEKDAAVIHDESTPLADRRNMAYKGTVVSYGRARGIIVGTGMDTELGRIASMLQNTGDTKTPLQKRLAHFGRRLGIAVLAVCAIVFISGIIRGEDALFMFLTGVSLAVAAIPEALPAVVTISLAIGAKKMVKQNALVRKLPAVETLGSVTYICSDKTGTLTMNRMSVEELYFMDNTIPVKDWQPDNTESGLNIESRASVMLYSLCISNDAESDREGRIMGDPTETALLALAADIGLDKKKAAIQYPRIGEIPFDSDRKCMTTLHSTPEGKVISITKGAIESVLAGSVRCLGEHGISDLDAKDRETVRLAGDSMAAEGLRTLAFAFRLWDTLPDSSADQTETEMTFAGMAGLMDPPRQEAAEAVAMCRTAGIRPVMITGDHPLTARNIARRLGILNEDHGVTTGRDLARLPLEDFEEKVGKLSVYARVAPEQKIKIVQALQDRGEFVAMTGDGVNDAPALKSADIGIAMGITGTDVSKESSDMILLDDNFATIVKSVREGRRIFDNIRKFIKYTMTSNSGEIWTIFLPPFLGLPIPLLPIHILWINLVTDGLPGLALAAEPAEKNIMDKPPRHPKESIFAHGLGYHLFWVGLLMGSVTIFTQAWFIDSGTHWQTMVFTVLSLSQMGHVLAVRSEQESLFSTGIFSNKPLLGAVLLTFVLQMGTIYIPVFNRIFRTAPLTSGELFVTLLLSSVVFFAVEAEKCFIRYRRHVSS